MSGTIYIGFQQILPDGLHLGFDRNTTSNANMFYNIGGGWNNVGVANGSFMIRPVMGDTNLFAGIQELDYNSQVMIFPNPSQGIITIKTSEKIKPQALELYTIEGQLIDRRDYSTSLIYSELRSGVYLIKVIFENGVVTKKITIQN